MSDFPRTQLTVLVTGAGAPGIAGTLYALRRNPDGVTVRTVTTDIRPNPVGRHLCDDFVQLPAPEDPGYLPTLKEACRRLGVDVVLPQTTREIARLSAAQSSLAAEGLCIVAPSGHAVEVGNSKLGLLEAMDRQPRLKPFVPRFAVARSRDEVEAAVRRMGYPDAPVAIKPCVSNGMRGFRVVRESAWDLKRFLDEKPSGVEIGLAELLAILGSAGACPDLLVMEYLPGAEYSVDAFRGERAEVAVPRLRRVIRSGISFENSIELRPDLSEATLETARVVGLTSCFGLQFKIDSSGHPKVLECNPRVQGTMVASCFAGVNIIWMAVREALGHPVEPGSWTLRPAEFVRYWGGVGIADGVVDVI